MSKKEYSYDDLHRGGAAVLECVRNMAEQVKESSERALQENATEYFRAKEKLHRHLTESERKDVRKEMALSSLKCERALAEMNAITWFGTMLHTWGGDTVARVISDEADKNITP